MNLVEAYKEAKVGEAIKLNNFYNTLIKQNMLQELYEFIGTLTTEIFLSDDWQIERKPMVWEGEVEWDRYDGTTIIYPKGALFHGNSLWSELEGKRTKIRIEEIMEE